MQHKSDQYSFKFFLMNLCRYVFFFLSVLILSACKSSAPEAHNIAIYVDDNSFRYSNVQQWKATIQMQSHKNNLFIYVPSTVNSREPVVFRFNQNGVFELDDFLINSRTRALWNDSVAGFYNGYMYIKRYPDKAVEKDYPKKAELICYDLMNETSTSILNTEKASDFQMEIRENGTIYVTFAEISKQGDTQYRIIQNNQLSENNVEIPINCRSGTAAEVIRNYNNAMQILSDTQLDSALDGLATLGINNHGCVLYPSNNGCLLHLGGSGIPLVYISTDGGVIPLLEYDCFYSSSSFNYYGDYAFLSLIRYEKRDDTWDYFLEKYENDTISGTYRINLNDLSIKKINDEYYNGIFIFGEESIFVCDSNNGVYRMDTDGRITATLIGPNS